MKKKLLVLVLTLTLTLALSLPAFAGQIENRLERSSFTDGIGFGVRADGLLIPASYTAKNGKTFELSYVEPMKEKGHKYYWVIYLVEE